mmetsp:Transcript_30204/g.49239  ORF Transcript_30204/g.49239 Transcript_30204/m.49239 type:complete len:249 (-) Transcript_30204:424-1170(-)
MQLRKPWHGAASSVGYLSALVKKVRRTNCNTTSSRRRIHADALDEVGHSFQLSNCDGLPSATENIDSRMRGVITPELIEQLSSVAIDAFLPEIGWFFSKATAYRDQKKAKIRNILFMEIMEDFIISQSSLCLDFLSAETKSALTDCFVALPHFLALPPDEQEELQPTPVAGQNTQETSWCSVWTTVYQNNDYDLPDPLVLNDAMHEALAHLVAASKKAGLESNVMLLVDRLHEAIECCNKDVCSIVRK